MQRRLSWVKAAHRAFMKFPDRVRAQAVFALDAAAAGEMASTVKPMKGLGAGVFEVRIAYRSDAYRVIYAVKVDQDIWVIHAFQKKSTQGIKTPKHEIDIVRSRLQQLKEN